LQLQFLYQVALADKVKDKVIVDVGSRLGAVLYAVSIDIGNRFISQLIINYTGSFIHSCP
jgi:hypothetical protein